MKRIGTRPRLRKILRPTHKELKKECDALWSECVKAKAGYKSEISGRRGRQIQGENVLNAHHIDGKDCYRLRYSLDNGICLTKGEHKYIAHVEGRKAQFNEKVKELRGWDIFDQLAMDRRSKFIPDLLETKLYLTQKLEEFTREKKYSMGDFRSK